VYKEIRIRNFWGAKRLLDCLLTSYIFLDLSAPGLPTLSALAPPATVKPFQTRKYGNCLSGKVDVSDLDGSET
jgi:hypothetical protein